MTRDEAEKLLDEHTRVVRSIEGHRIQGISPPAGYPEKSAELREACIAAMLEAQR